MAMARWPNSGLVLVTSSPLSALHRDLIVSLAARYSLPAIHYQRGFVSVGGLMLY